MSDYATDWRERGLEELWTAHAVFGAACERVPDEALGFRPDADEYSLGGMPIHVGHVLAGYIALLRDLSAVLAQPEPADATAEGPLEAPVVEMDPADTVTLHDGPPPVARRALQAQLEDGLRSTARIVLELPPGRFDRKVPVVYAPDPEPLPTSPGDVVGWLRDHAEAHARQVDELIEAWRAGSRSAPASGPGSISTAM